MGRGKLSVSIILNILKVTPIFLITKSRADEKIDKEKRQMASVKIHKMYKIDEYFVGTCTHVNDTPECLSRNEIDVSAKRRIDWLRGMEEKGSQVKVASIANDQVGFLHIMPIEICPWGPAGKDLMVIPCLCVLERTKHRGVGRALINSAEEAAREQGCKGIITVGYYYDDCWFMPAPFFEKCGFSVVKSNSKTVILGKFFDLPVKLPQLLKPNYQFKSIPGKVVVDLFWNTFCQTSAIEAQQVREVASEFGESIIVNEYCADDRLTLSSYQIPRRIFINGKEIWWGHEVPKEAIQGAITKVLGNN